MSLRDIFSLLTNIRLINIVVLILAIPHYIITIYLLKEHAGRLPRPIEIIVMLVFLYLMEQVVEQGENKFQRFFGYFGSYFLLAVFVWSVFSYLIKPA